MPDAEEAPRRPPRRRAEGRGRVALIVAAVLLVFLITSLRGIASFWTDYLWFDSLDQGGVFTGRLKAQATLVAMFTGTFFVLQWANLLIADRLAPAFRAPGPEEEVVERYRELVGKRVGLVRALTAAVFALIVGAGTSGQWQSWILFRNAVDFGPETDPLFGKDIGFYVFQLPFLSFAVGWLFAALVIVLLLTTVAHYLNGGIRLQVPGPERVTPQVKVHLSVLLGLLALVRAVDYYLERYELTVSTRGAVDGATYTDVNAQLPATNLLILIAVSAAALFLLNIRRKGWVLPALAIGIWAIVAIVGGAIVPALVQRVQVQPEESARERPFIERNIAATRAAFGLDAVEEVGFEGEQALTGADLVANAQTIRNIRLWDTETLADTYQSLQGLRAGYQITDVDVDRYEIDGELTQVMIAARELETGALPQTSWEARHLTFTHGYGVVASPANSKESNGRPDLVVSEVPLRDEIGLDIAEPGIYVGEDQSGYVITRTDREEVDFQSDERTEFTEYDGEDGVGIGSFVRRAAFALRFGDANPLFSGNLRSDSRIHYQRDVRERVSELAPFLTLDSDPYPVVVGGRVLWVVDAYTTSSRYPYAERAVVDGENDLDRRFNYIRNSVKAVVDAYDGTVTFYVVDQDDPIIRAYMAAFPELFSTDEPPAELVAHFRYPEDLFRVQTNMWGRYRITDPDDFFNRIGGWVVAQDPERAAGGGDSTGDAAADDAAADPDAAITTEDRIEPYYLLTALPGETETSFVMLRPFTPIQEGAERRSLLTGFLVASSEPGSYGQLISYGTRSSNQVDGPAIVAGTIRSFEAVSEDQTDLCREGSGSTCTFGNLVFVPIEQGILYVQPLYIQREGSEFPVLRKVIVEFNGDVGYADTLREALLQLFDEVPETLEDDAPTVIDGDGDADEDSGGDGEPAADATAGELLDEAERLFTEADAALAESDLATYAEKVEQARELIRRAQSLLDGGAGAGAGGGSGEPATSTTTTTTEPRSA